MLGVVVMFVEYINKFFIPIRDLSAKYAVMQGAMAASERIFQLLDTDEYDGGTDSNVTRPEHAHPAPDKSGPAVELAGVHFSYGAEPVLRGVDVRVSRGSTIAVVGATGSGKSTVIKLLTRLYERDRGAIRFAGTLEDNITLGKPFGRDQIETAIRRVGLDRALARRGTGLETRVAERGAN